MPPNLRWRFPLGYLNVLLADYWRLSRLAAAVPDGAYTHVMRARLNAMRYVLNKLPYTPKDLQHVGKLDSLIVGRAHVVYERGERTSPTTPATD